MFLITKLKEGSLTSVPATVPVSLLNSVAGAGLSNVPLTPGIKNNLPSNPSIASPSISKLVPQMTGASNFSQSHLPDAYMQTQRLAPQMTGTYQPSASQTSTPTMFSPIAAPPTNSAAHFGEYQVGMTDEERSRSQGFFMTLDTAKRGSLSGGECFPVFSKSNLPADELAKIWDLVDTSKKGSIEMEAFVTAMYVIKKRIEGVPIPSPRPSQTSQPLAPVPTSSFAPSSSIDFLSSPIVAASIPAPLEPSLGDPIQRRTNVSGLSSPSICNRI